MAEHTASVRWARGSDAFIRGRYSRAHRWRFDGGVEVPASASPHNVRAPFSDPAAVDPEEAFVAALSSCHMLFFLSIAASRGLVVESYADDAVGVMARNDAGKEAIVEVRLEPRVVLAGDRAPTDGEIEAIHHEAHEACFLASSVRSAITIAGTWAMAGEARAAAEPETTR